jgi:hypothetical protein
MKTRSLYIFVGVLVLAIVQMACSATSGKSVPTAPPDATVAVSTEPSSSSGSCPALNTAVPKPSGLVKSVTMAEGAQGDNKDPVNPTTTFNSKAEFHAVVATQDAPTDTAYKSVWYATDTHGAVDCNTKIDEYELKTDGNRNVDFSLSPKTTWPAGTYRVEIFVNGTLDQVVSFDVK